MHLCQIEQNGHLIRSNSIKHNSSGKHRIVNNYFTNSTPGNTPVSNNRITHSSPYGITPFSINKSTQGSNISRSFYQKSQNQDYQSFMKYVNQKMLLINKTLTEHQSKINILQDKKQGNQLIIDQTIIDSLMYSQKLTASEHQKRTFQQKVFFQIQKLRQQINNPLAKSQYIKQKLHIQQNELNVQAKLLDKINQLKQKMCNQLRSLNQCFKKQLQCQVLNITEINKSVFNKIQKNIKQLFKKIDIINQENDNKDKSSKQRYLGKLQIMKFKQIIEKNINSNNSEEIVVNEAIYYLDKDGYLLDKQGFYLIDDHNKWVQLENKQIKILKAYGLLQQQ